MTRAPLKIALIDYGAGNLHSAGKALERAATIAGLAATVTVTDDARVVAAADRIVLPGDGAFRDCMTALQAAPDMIGTLDARVRRSGVPFLGICVGMQLLATTGLEHGETPGLGWLAGVVKPIEPSRGEKVPHMGWNTLNPHGGHPLLAGIPLGPHGLHAYFLHGYHLAVAAPGTVIATSDYAHGVTAIVADGPIAGVQFHPEKSQTLGLALLANFLRWRP
jgi:glutamine amidotransferase